MATLTLGVATALSGSLAFATDDADTRRPSAPVITTARQERAGQVQLVWIESRDNVGVTEYRILGNGKPLITLDATANLFETFWFLEDLPPGNLWIQIQAVDAAGNASVRSAPSYVRINNNRMRPPTNVAATYDIRRDCVTVSFDPSPDERPVTEYFVRENLHVIATIRTDEVVDGERITTESCTRGGRGYTGYIQVEARGLFGNSSVRTAPVAVYRHYYYAPTGFSVDVNGATVTLTWDAPQARMRAESFRIINRRAPIKDVPADARSTVIELEPGQHWLQLATVNDDGGQSRRTAPIAITIPVEQPDSVTGSIGGWVFFDDNGDGLQTTGEPGLADARVSLIDTTANAVVDVITTGADGEYLFTELRIDRCYSVSLTYRGAAPTLPSVGDDPTIDSDIGSDGTSDQICLTADTTSADIDAGIAAAR